MQYTELGARIASKRIRANLTQTELAQRAGLSLASVQKLEQGVTNNPRLATIRALAEAMGLPMIDLIPECTDAKGQINAAPDECRKGTAVGWCEHPVPVTQVAFEDD